MAAPTTAVQDVVNIRVGWVAADANSDPLVAYEILILTGDGTTFAEETTTCDGSSNGPLTNKYCDIPMSTLRAPPFNLAQGAAVVARIRAQNSIGWGASSYDTETAGAAVLEDVPHQLPAPSRGLATSVSQVEAEWAALIGDQTGGNTIESYQLQWDAGSTGAGWYDLQGGGGPPGPTAAEYSLLTSHTVSTGVSAGETYWLRVRARNAHGWGPYSATAVLYAYNSWPSWDTTKICDFGTNALIYTEEYTSSDGIDCENVCAKYGYYQMFWDENVYD
jgi:hypothetical protein